MKIKTTDALKIARLFGCVSDGDVPRHIERLDVTHPSEINTLASFKLHKFEYAILFDDTANDNVAYILEQVHVAMPGRKGEVLKNPDSDVETYGAPYEGKDCYMVAFGRDTVRLDVFLAETHPELSRSSWQKHIKAGRVSVNKKPQTQAHRTISPNDDIKVTLPEPPDYSKKDLPIIFQDEHLTVINKPAGVLTHPKNPLDDEFTVLDIAKRYFSGESDDEMRHGIVHRLDRDTSGLLAIARTPEAYHHFKRQFAERLAAKTYIAITKNTPPQDEMLLDLPIFRNPAKPGSFMVARIGKPATTKLFVEEANADYSRLRLEPKTGRTHQLRVHLAYIGCPIVGDRLYGRAADRLYLHAHQLEFDMPDGSRQAFTADVPGSFTNLLRGQ